ncbi:MAG: hypothetical protein ABSE47_01930 [Acidimicrobiales bacterium]
MTPRQLLDVPLDGRFRVPADAEASSDPAAYAICSLCHGPAAPGRRRCWSCMVVAGQLGSLPPVVPLFLFGLGSPAHRALVGYKAAVAPAARSAWRGALSDLFARWLDDHADCLVGSQPDGLLVPVPSSSGGRASWQGRHPLEEVCRSASDLGAGFGVAPVLGPGATSPRRLQARTDGFSVTDPDAVDGRTLVVVDDMFVSGARSLSAAAALRGAGARVAAVVPLGRLVRADHNAATAAFWAARTAAFDPSRCCRCALSVRPVPVHCADRSSAWPRRLYAVSERVAA